VASLVLALVGLFASPLLVPAIIFGAVAMSQTGKDSSLGGKGLAVAGFVIGIVGVVVWLIVLAVLFWFLSSLRSLVVP
jgi:hypothetical protein